MLVNKHTKTASTIHWTSNKIEGEIDSDVTAEAIAMQEMFDTIFFVKATLKEMCGKRVSNLQCIALSNNRELLSSIRRIKLNEEVRGEHLDILELKNNLEQEKVVQELRYVCPSFNVAEALTRTTKTEGTLQQLVQEGRYDLPGGYFVRTSTLTADGTGHKPTSMEQCQE